MSLDCKNNLTAPCRLDVPIFSLDISHLRATEVFFGIWYCDFNEQKNFKKHFNKIWHSAFSQMIQFAKKIVKFLKNFNFLIIKMASRKQWVKKFENTF